jgi:pSer/pThr/pTyr-binding forkhead associated (FHA) protein
MLELIGGSGRRLVELTGDRATVGKAASNDVVVADATVSDLHAVLERFANTWTVRDLGSRNGTFLNGERMFSATY